MLHNNELKRQLGYTNPKSRVYFDGREVLAGEDWAKRKQELWDRAQGRCERFVAGNPIPERCRSEGHDPDHVIKRSKQRDDRLTNLELLCRMHHDLKHPEKNKVHWSKK